MNRLRKAPPFYVRYIYRAIKNSKFEQLTMEQLVKILKGDAFISDEIATEIITRCICDKILIPVVVDQGRGSPRLKVAEGRPLSLPTPIEIPTSQHDYYCFECHLPGDLEQCPTCPRSFHRECYRQDPEKPNYEIPSAKVQKNPLPEFSSDSEVGADNSIMEPETKSATHQIVTNTANIIGSRLSVTGAELEENKTNFDLNVDNKSRVDVMCLGQTRPPNRSRRSNVNSIYAKNEIVTLEDDDQNENSLCTCCRLYKCAELKNPPNMESDELCYLLSFIYNRNISWLSSETISQLDDMVSENKEMELLQKVLLQIPTAPKDLNKNIENASYTYLMEFLIDVLDIQHNVGVLYGNDSTELDSTKWLVRDVNHDLAEIGRCPDCYRYSNQQNAKGWFCKPCVQRHELVFAKHPGFPFWPAKVIRVLPNNKYDVRFFGGNHSRALVDVKHIRSIDTDPKQLKLPKSFALRSAMEELKHHQLLLQYPPSQFSFRANREHVQAILDRVLLNSSISPQRQRRSGVSKSPILSIQKEQSVVVTQSSSRKRRRESATNQEPTLESSSNNGATYNKRLRESSRAVLDVETLQKKLDGALKIVERKTKNENNLAKLVKALQENQAKSDKNLEIVKRKQWCFWCLKEAILLCCFKASYCSEECQKAHWEDGHSKVCKNRDLH